jgi:regulator of protease activity HflC (stomatin/prohibitin superfamily)
VITSDNLVVSIDTVIYFQVNDPKSATYEIANFIQGIEQLTVTTLRNVIGSLDLEQTLTSRDQINGQLRGVLDEATGKWGIRVNRVELKAIDPPASVQDSMEKQMRAERDRRATILTAEGIKQSAILTAEGNKQSAILTAEGQAQSAILKAQGESRAILQVFEAIHKGNADDKLLAYQYLQVLPQIARGESNKMWIIPTEMTQALSGIGRALGGAAQDSGGYLGEKSRTTPRRTAGSRRRCSRTPRRPWPGRRPRPPGRRARPARPRSGRAAAAPPGRSSRTRQPHRSRPPGSRSSSTPARARSPRPGTRSRTTARTRTPPARASSATAGRPPGDPPPEATPGGIRDTAGVTAQPAVDVPDLVALDLPERDEGTLRWCFADQLGPSFVDDPDGDVLLLETTTVFRRRCSTGARRTWCCRPPSPGCRAR